MARNMVILVSDSPDLAHKTRTWSQGNGCTVNTYTNSEWTRGMQDPNFRTQLGLEVTSLATGSQPVDQGAKILPFPSGGGGNTGSNGKVHTINELESIAIENAIHQFNGNLTEAAKALGIGRATLYRKVKQYNIDPSAARKKRAA